MLARGLFFDDAGDRILNFFGFGPPQPVQENWLTPAEVSMQTSDAKCHF